MLSLKITLHLFLYILKWRLHTFSNRKNITFEGKWSKQENSTQHLVLLAINWALSLCFKSKFMQLLPSYKYNSLTSKSLPVILKTANKNNSNEVEIFHTALKLFRFTHMSMWLQHMWKGWKKKPRYKIGSLKNGAKIYVLFFLWSNLAEQLTNIILRHFIIYSNFYFLEI